MTSWKNKVGETNLPMHSERKDKLLAASRMIGSATQILDELAMRAAAARAAMVNDLIEVELARGE